MTRTHTFSTRQRRQFLAQTLGLSALAVCFGLLFAFGNARGDDGAERLTER